MTNDLLNFMAAEFYLLLWGNLIHGHKVINTIRLPNWFLNLVITIVVCEVDVYSYSD